MMDSVVIQFSSYVRLCFEDGSDHESCLKNFINIDLLQYPDLMVCP